VKKTSIDSSRYGDLIHIALGGAICLFAMYILALIVPITVQMILFSLGCLGLLSLKETVNAMLLLLFGTAYLPSGFTGGLYIGYKIKKNLRIILIFPALIGFIGMITLRFFTGYLDFSRLNLQQEILIPLLGNILGTYLGGYTINWEKEEVGEP